MIWSKKDHFVEKNDHISCSRISHKMIPEKMGLHLTIASSFRMQILKDNPTTENSWKGKYINGIIKWREILTAYLLHSAQISQQAPCLFVSCAFANLTQENKIYRMRNKPANGKDVGKLYSYGDTNAFEMLFTLLVRT